jgi:hypothetical protein
MQTNYIKNITFAFFLIVTALIVWYAHNILLLAFVGIILAILLNALGKGAKKITKLPYLFSIIHEFNQLNRHRFNKINFKIVLFFKYI